MKIIGLLSITAFMLLTFITGTQCAAIKAAPSATKGVLLEKKATKEVGTKISNRDSRKLPDEKEPPALDVVKRVTLKGFMLDIVQFIHSAIEMHVSGAIIRAQGNNGAEVYHGGEKLFTYTWDKIEDEELDIQEVKFEFINIVIESTLTIEKTRIHDYVKDYVMQFFGNFLLKVQQTVLSCPHIFGDLKATLSYINVSPEYSDDDLDYRPKKKEERRLALKTTDDLAKSLLEYRPIYSHTSVKVLDLKNKRYSSKNPKVLAFLKNYELKPYHRISKQERRLTVEGEGEEEEEGPQVLKRSNPRYVANKAHFFKPDLLSNMDKIRLAIGTVGMQDGKIKFTLIPSRPNLSMIRGEVQIMPGNNTPVTITFKSSSFMSTMHVSIPTKRFIIKHLRLETEAITKVLQILDHLNDLRVWRDYYQWEKAQEKHQYEIVDFMQPNVLYMMFRAEFDNLTDGQTASEIYGRSNWLSFEHTTSEEATVWWLVIYKHALGRRHEVVRNLMAFSELGKDFAIFTYAAEITVNESVLGLGERFFPDNSMFNQHFLVRRFLDLQVEFVVNGDADLQPYKENITPFMTNAFRYTDVLEIPAVANPDQNTDMTKYFYAIESNGKDSLEIKQPGCTVVSQLCPVLSSEYNDSINLSNGQYSFGQGRFSFRPDIDYCYTMQCRDWAAILKLMKGDEGGEAERRLREVQENTATLV